MSLNKILIFKYELQLVIIVSIIFAFFIYLGEYGWVRNLRILLGLPFILFFPGYTLTIILFPQKEDLGLFVRLVIGSGLSIVVVTLLGFGLNYTRWGISVNSTFFTLVVFILLASCLAIYRRHMLPQTERYIPVLNLHVLSKISLVERVLSGFLILALLFTVGFTFYVFSNPNTGEDYTDFYMLGKNGKAENYPQSLAVMEEEYVLTGIINHEHRTVDYYIQVKMGDYIKSNIGPITLENDQKWEDNVKFSAQQPYENLKVEFLLFREGDLEPYRSLHLWITVHK
ncbi:DUF1616 domain-containing protein [Pelotomaculum propionicicum]|uniref:DUF1616 domain-containing protein n=1 Tax=Pelotomaculum propionicicum TaxID=258475 RepID=A0A4Y7RRZ8_9FIRM|nr:DUF1616 domain-containing protein [Pelotomaculum propionicicum]TEB11047.1 hypothetical protein Pmgp_01919 [Pelotomaculum propionicicum]